MYNLDTEEGQMMVFLEDLLKEGEYSDASTLAKQILQDDPNNIDAINVLAVVYEKMAVASSDGGDEESEKEFLNKALSLYLKLLSINPGSVAEKIKVHNIRTKLTGKEEFNEFYLQNKYAFIKEKCEGFVSKYSSQKWYKISIIVLPVLIILAIGLGIYNHQKTPKIYTPTEELASNSETINGDAPYNGPTDTIVIENDNAKAERLNKEFEEKAKEMSKEAGKEEAKEMSGKEKAPVDSYVKPNRKTKGSSTQNNHSVYDENQNVTNPGVKPFKLSFDNLELKEPEKETVSNNETTTQEKTEPKVETKQETKSPNMKKADVLLNRAVKEQNSGNVSEAKKYANEAKNIYSEEISNGSNSRRARTNIETADTILGNN